MNLSLYYYKNSTRIEHNKQREISEMLDENSDNGTEIVDYFDNDYDDEIDEIFADDQAFVDAERENGQRYIGLIGCFPPSGDRLLMTSISASTFFEYPFHSVERYLIEYTNTHPSHLLPGVRIIQLSLTADGFYRAVDKTVYIIRVQRWWRKRLRGRMFRHAMHRPTCLYWHNTLIK
jgi:hypothetical protein